MSEPRYDEFPYESVAIHQSHPDRLAAVGRLFGMAPEPVASCRVLELGCASGGNIIPIAMSLPGSEFVGIDLSERQIRDGRAVVAALGLKNIRLEAESIAAIDGSWGRFDYILCHGVYSWVPPNVRDALLAVCHHNMSPRGIAYVSYNTYPGWHARKVAEGMIRYHVAAIDDPRKQVAQARALISVVAERLPERAVHRIALEREIEILDRVDDAYIYHEHLEPVNDPCYFHEFARHATAAGLQYLGDTALSTMAAANLPEDLAKLVEHLGSDLLGQEQYMDFVRNRTFRSTLLCHADVSLERSLQSSAIGDLLLRSSARTRGEPVGLEPGHAESFDCPTGPDFKVPNSLTKAAFAVLGDRYPAALSIADLRKAAERHLREAGLEAQISDDQRRRFGADLLRGAFADVVELRTWQPRVAIKIPEFPRANPLVALQVALGRDHVTNAFHETVELDAAMQVLVPLLDGTRKRADFHHREDVLGKLAANSLLEA